MLPTESAAIVGPSPIEPEMPFKTMSQATAAISDALFAPSITSVWFAPESIRVKVSRSPVVPTTGTEKRFT
ncbi:unannotated protein [freshwater metagenome]|uniref:Unannotated protein n=1 Tax=freshwater metagenome TaxID=449393 RepID=A0A6J6SXY0_9ZZZZ